MLPSLRTWVTTIWARCYLEAEITRYTCICPSVANLTVACLIIAAPRQLRQALLIEAAARALGSSANTSRLYLYISEGARTSLSHEAFLFDADNLKQFIADLGDNNNYNTKSLQIGAAALALLTEDDIALAVAKNYTLS